MHLLQSLINSVAIPQSVCLLASATSVCSPSGIAALTAALMQVIRHRVRRDANTRFHTT